MKVILLHVLFFVIGLFVAFALIPFDQMVFENYPVDAIKQDYQDAFALKSGKAWKIVYFWFIGLTCARLMVRALKYNTQTTKSKDST